jgi:glycosyltransferase involved in cell wall biosynthesis
VGDGPALAGVRAELRRSGLDERVLLLGARRDVPALMRDVFDVFVLPSRREGLPLALVEAQAAQLPCVVSDAVTREADVPGARIVRLPLASGPGPWARTILDLAHGSGVEARAARSPVAGTAFDIATGAERLAALYSGARC